MRRAALVAAVAIGLGACTGTGTPPVQAQLATVCNTIATGYNTAAGYRAQGKLTPAQMTALHDMEPAVMAVCNKTNPPADLASALNAASAAASQIALINAGVR